MAANRLATSGEEWCRYFSNYNSGTYVGPPAHTLFYQVYYQTAHIYVYTNTVYKVYTQVRQLCKTTYNLLLYFATPTLSVVLFKCTSRLQVVLQSFLMFMSCYFVHSVSIYTCAIRYSLSLYVYSTITHTIEIEPNFYFGIFLEGKGAMKLASPFLFIWDHFNLTFLNLLAIADVFKPLMYIRIICVYFWCT